MVINASANLVTSEHSLCLGLLIPVRNRQHYTLAILAQLTQQIQAQAHAHRLQVIVIDDASEDGTPEAIAANFPSVTVLNGNGELWWTGAIATGMEYATTHLAADYLVWLNDDIILADDFISQLIKQCQNNQNRQVITGGIILDQTYRDWIVFGGVIASQPINCLQQFAEKSLLKVDTLNGNLVILPARLVSEIGLPNTQRFRHYGGDYEYICRAKEVGYTIELSSLIQAKTDFSATDVIRYMPLWIQWYRSRTWQEKYQVLKNLKSRKSPHNVEHMVNSIYRRQPQVPTWKYYLFYFRKLIKLFGSELVPKRAKHQHAQIYLAQRCVPSDLIQTILE